jgi:hypothetical protein
MTDPAPRRRTVPRWRALVLLAAAILLAGCELATGTVRTATELQDAGIRNPDLQYDNGVARLRFDADPNPLEARAEQDRAAAIIWRNLPFRIDRIVVTADGGAFPNRRDYPRALLEQRLGPRPADLDRSVGDIARRATLIAVAVGVVLLVAIIVIIVLVVRAVRRRPAPQPAGAWPGGGPQPWGQPGQPGWGQQPPPSWGQAPPPSQPQPWAQPPPAPPPPPPRQPAAPASDQAGAAEDWPAGAPRPEPPPRGPGDTQRLEPEPPPEPPREERGPTPPS